MRSTTSSAAEVVDLEAPFLDDSGLDAAFAEFGDQDVVSVADDGAQPVVLRMSPPQVEPRHNVLEEWKSVRDILESAKALLRSHAAILKSLYSAAAKTLDIKNAEQFAAAQLDGLEVALMRLQIFVHESEQVARGEAGEPRPADALEALANLHYEIMKMKTFLGQQMQNMDESVQAIPGVLWEAGTAVKSVLNGPHEESRGRLTFALLMQESSTALDRIAGDIGQGNNIPTEELGKVAQASGCIGEAIVAVLRSGELREHLQYIPPTRVLHLERAAGQLVPLQHADAVISMIYFPAMVADLRVAVRLAIC